MAEARSGERRMAALPIADANAICYSGYREGQSPQAGKYPTYAEVREDLLMLSRHWQLLRLYDCGPHAELVLRVIRNERFDLRVMLGLDLAAELSNPQCPWGAEYDQPTLRANGEHNRLEVERAIALANRYADRVFAISVGNEATVDWSDHLVPVDSLLSHVRRLREATQQPITFCENYVPWTGKLEALAAELDFICLHSYPVWEYKHIDEALAYTQENYYGVARRYPQLPVVITEAGWTTASNGQGIEPWNACEEHQARYVEELTAWTRRESILCFLFEAFDEPWKGSDDPLEPEKHWGLFRVDRSPKLAAQALYPTAAPAGRQRGTAIDNA